MLGKTAIVPLVLAVAAAVRAGPPFDPAEFERLSPEQRLELLVSAAQWRERELGNFEYKLRRTLRNVDLASGALLERFRPADYSMKRLGRRYWFHAQFYQEDGSRGNEYELYWDGAVNRFLQLRPPGSGRIEDKEFSIIDDVWFHHLFGIRVKFGTMSLAEWVADPPPAERRKLLEVLTVAEDDALLVRVHFTTDQYNHIRFWFDPARDYLPVRFDHRYAQKQEPDFDSYSQSWENHHVTEARQVDGLWVPWRIVVRSGMGGKTVASEWTYLVTHFTRGTVREADLEVVYPPGTRVVDTIRLEGYVVQADGDREYFPIYDAVRGKILHPPGQEPPMPPTPHLPALPEALARAPAPTAVAAPPAAAHPSPGRWVLIAGGIVVGAVGCWLIYRSARARAPAQPPGSSQ